MGSVSNSLEATFALTCTVFNTVQIPRIVEQIIVEQHLHANLFDDDNFRGHLSTDLCHSFEVICGCF